MRGKNILNTLRTKLKLLSLNDEAFTLSYEGYSYFVASRCLYRYEIDYDWLRDFGLMLDVHKVYYYMIPHEKTGESILQAIQVIKLYELGERLKAW